MTDKEPSLNILMMSFKNNVKRLLLSDITHVMPWDEEHSEVELDEEVSLDEEFEEFCTTSKLHKIHQIRLKSLILKMFKLWNTGDEIDKPHFINPRLKSIAYWGDDCIEVEYYSEAENEVITTTYKKGRKEFHFLKTLLFNEGEYVPYVQLVKRTLNPDIKEIRKTAHRTKDNVLRKCEGVLSPYIKGGKGTDAYMFLMSEYDFYLNDDFDGYISARNGGDGTFTVFNKSYQY